MSQLNYINFILDTVRYRINSLSSEILLIDEQLKHVGKAPGTTEVDRRQTFLQRNIKATLHDLLLEYVKTMEKMSSKAAPLKMAISCHLYTMGRPEFEILLQELYGQQSALTTLVGSDYQKYTRDVDVPADVHLRMIALVFPYEFIVDLLKSPDFFQKLIITVLDYTPKTHVQAVSAIFNVIRKFRSLSSISNSCHFFTANNPMYFALAEHFVTIFTHKKMLKINWKPLRNLSVSEKSILLTQLGPESCDLKESILKRLLNYEIHDFSEEKIFSRPIKSPESPELEFESNEQFKILSLKHIILELRKIPLQPSPSSMLYIMSNALNWLSSALSYNSDLPGADEIFQFFVYCLSSAKIYCLPAIVSFIESFVDDALMETKFQYLITQLKCGLEFIEARLLPVQPFVLFPFKNIPTRLKGLLELSDNKPLILRRFSVYSFPTFLKEFKFLFPSMIRYTGNLSDIAIVWKYQLTPGSSNKLFNGFSNEFEFIPTLLGPFFQLTTDFIEKNQMIKIDDGDFNNNEEKIMIMSTMLLMSNAKIISISLSKFDLLFENVKNYWNLNSNDPFLIIKIKIAEIQQYLTYLELLPNNILVDGYFNYETFETLLKLFNKKKNEFEFTPKVFNYLKSIVKL